MGMPMPRFTTAPSGMSRATPVFFSSIGGALSLVRAVDLCAIPIKALMARHLGVDWAAVTDLICGCANLAGGDNRNVPAMNHAEIFNSINDLAPCCQRTTLG